MMRTAMIGLLAETSVHPGSGRSMGVVDLPVAREAATDYPILAGSSLKGAMRSKAAAVDPPRMDMCFGKHDRAGELLISDARLMLLPLRSLSGASRWATCPHLVERYQRDLARAGLEPCPSRPNVDKGSVLAVDGSGGSTAEGDLFLEERQFKVNVAQTDELVKAIQPLILHQETKKRLGDRIVVLHDDDFAWFARYGLSIQARNELVDDTKKSNNLWYEETLPPDTVMYALIAARSGPAAEALDKLFPEKNPYLQAGGNETVGQGWFAVTVRSSQGKAE